MGKKHNRYRNRERDVSTITRTERLLTAVDDIVRLARPVPLIEVEDLRRFHPTPLFRPSMSIVQAKPSIDVKPSRLVRTAPLSARAAFDEPHKVVVCVRRKVRREVLFAKRKTGRGARSPKRRNLWSDVKC